jgi:Flp pilus assembly protein TadG
MAFVAPFVFLLVFASIEFSRMMMIRQALTNAAREGCRHACLVSTQQDGRADAVVRNRLQGVIANADDQQVVRVTFEPSFSTSPPSGTNITTSVEVDCEDVSWLPPFFFAGAKIRGTTSMDRE